MEELTAIATPMITSMLQGLNVGRATGEENTDPKVLTPSENQTARTQPGLFNLAFYVKEILEV